MTYEEKLAQLLSFFQSMVKEVKAMQTSELDNSKKKWINQEWSYYHAPSPEVALEKLDQLIEEEDDKYILATYNMLYGELNVVKAGFDQEELAEIFSEAL